jgi:hypothetical protein
MLEQNEVHELATGFAQFVQDRKYADQAEARAQISWDEVIRKLKNFDPVDSDRERIIEEARNRGHADVALARAVNKAFDLLHIVGKPLSSPIAPATGASIRRGKVVEVAIKQALGQAKGRRIRAKRTDMITSVETQRERGREERVLRDLRAEYWALFLKIGRLNRDTYDILSIEGVGKFFVEEYIPYFHQQNDEGIAKEEAAAKAATKKAANGGK